MGSQPRQITNKSREQNVKKSTAKGSNKLRENSIENSYYMSLTPTLNKRELDKVPKEKAENQKTVSVEAEDRTDKNTDTILSSSESDRSLLNSADNSWSIFSYFFPENQYYTGNSTNDTHDETSLKSNMDVDIAGKPRSLNVEKAGEIRLIPSNEGR